MRAPTYKFLNPQPSHFIDSWGQVRELHEDSSPEAIKIAQRRAIREAAKEFHKRRIRPNVEQLADATDLPVSVVEKRCREMEE